MPKRLLLLSALLFSLLAVESAAFAADGDYSLAENILYRDGEELTEYQKERCRLDVYYPAKQKKFATVVWFHGGGLKAGNRSVPKGLREQGIAVVAVNYRLHPQVKAPVYIEDAAAAVAWTFRDLFDDAQPEIVTRLLTCDDTAACRAMIRQAFGLLDDVGRAA